MSQYEETEVPPSPTGLYPGPIWGTPSEVESMSLSNSDETAVPPSPTGLYPGPIWADDTAMTVALDQPPEAMAELDMQEMYRIIREAAVGFSGDDTYSAIGGDHGTSTGLAFGLAHFTQASSDLGHVLAKMRERDAVLFAEVFGSDATALVETTNADTIEMRLRPVGGMPLWSATWVDRFRLAGALPACQAAQNEIAIEKQFRPMLPVAFAHGLVTDRALAVMYDFVASVGLNEALRAVIQTIGPVPAPPAELIARLVDGAGGAARQRLERIQRSRELRDITFRRP
jgi:hypothetical protein